MAPESSSGRHRLVLDAFTARLAEALGKRGLRAEAAHGAELEDANELRTALRAAVSHDLRTPLASITASATSLLQPDVHFSKGDTSELLKTIDEEGRPPQLARRQPARHEPPPDG